MHILIACKTVVIKQISETMNRQARDNTAYLNDALKNFWKLKRRYANIVKTSL